MRAQLGRFIFTLALASLTTGLVSACGSGFQGRQLNVASRDLTGATDTDGHSYTGASDSLDLEVLKQAIDPSPKPNLDLAASIASVTVKRLDLAGNELDVLQTSMKPLKLEIRIGFHTPQKVVVYTPVLSASHDAASVTSKDDAGATTLNVHCLDEACAAVQVRLKTGAAEAGFIYRVREVTLQSLGPFVPKNSKDSVAHLARIGALAMSAAHATLVTTEVAWGPAMFDLSAGDVEAAGDLVATGGDEQNVSVIAKNEAPIEGRLIGNNNHGDLLLRFSDLTAWSFLRIRLPNSPSSNGGATGAIAPVDDTPASERYVPFDLSNPITASFQRDRMNPVVIDAINNVTSFEKGGRGGDMKQFLNRAKPNLDLMIRDLQTQAIPPELVFILFVESRYFYSNYDISVSSAGAIGPWQFMTGTARSLGLAAYEPIIEKTRVKDGKQLYHYVVNPCDQRADLDLSTKAAAKYLRHLLDTFQNDPELAVMAYNMGEGGMNRRLNCINQKKNGAAECSKSSKPLIPEDLAGLDYWTIRELNAAKKESIDYVPRFLAAQFVGREPSRYGFTVDTTGIAPVPSFQRPSTCK